MDEVNVDIVEQSRITFISSLMPSDIKEGIITTLQELNDCFAWNYDKMPGLDRSFVERRLPIKLKSHPF